MALRYSGPKAARADHAAGRAYKAKSTFGGGLSLLAGVPQHVRMNRSKYNLTAWRVGGGSAGGNYDYGFYTWDDAADAKPAPAPKPPASRPPAARAPAAPAPAPTPVTAPVWQNEIDEITKPARGLEDTVKGGPAEDPLSAYDDPTMKEGDAQVPGEVIKRPALGAEDDDDNVVKLKKRLQGLRGLNPYAPGQRAG